MTVGCPRTDSLGLGDFAADVQCSPLFPRTLYRILVTASRRERAFLGHWARGVLRLYIYPDLVVRFFIFSKKLPHVLVFRPALGHV